MLCPICKKIVEVTDPLMPFCSERCKLLDLGNWASERYVFSEPAPPPGYSDEGFAEDDE